MRGKIFQQILACWIYGSQWRNGNAIAIAIAIANAIADADANVIVILGLSQQNPWYGPMS